jgi:hypothetical protein
MLSILTLVCFLLAPRLAAVESLAGLPVPVPLPQDQASMTSSQDSRANEPPQTPRQAGLNIPHHPHSWTAADAGDSPSSDHGILPLDTQKPISNMASGVHHPPIADLPKRLAAHLPLNLTCNPSLDPSDHQKKRVIFVGDVHGHIVSLRALLHKLKFDEKNGDHLVFVGDLVNKGPDSAGVVALAMDVGASAVRGNHEDNVLRAHKTLQKKKHRKAQEILETVPDRGTDGSTFGSREDLTETRKNHNDQARSVAKSLSKKQINWLSSLPLMLRIPHLHGATHPPWNAKEIIVVHAGLVPALPLHKQDPWAIMNMRTLLYRLRAKADGVPDAADVAPPSAGTERHIEAIPSDARQGEPWSHSWNRFQNLSFPLHSDRTLVIYGHDARAGLQANPKVVIRPHPAARRGRHLNAAAAAAQRRNDVNGIEVNIGPEIEVENDGDVAIDVDSGVTINATTTTTTSDSEAEAKMKKRTDIEINVNPTEVLNADGDVETEVEGEFEIEIENENDAGRKKARRDVDDDTIELSVTPVIAVEADGDVDVGVEVDMEVAVVNGSVHVVNGTMCKRDGEGAIVVPGEREVDDEDDDDDDNDDDDDDETGSDNDVEAERRKKKKGGRKGGRKRKGVRYAFGIDSGCGHGRKLTALVLEATEPDGVVMHRLEQVDCGAEGRG